jgi:hypothetical protein
MSCNPALHWTLAIALLLLAADTAAADPVEEFYARRTVTITIGYTAGGSYDLYGRMVARHLGKHIPGQPTVIAQNMPGAGSLKAANYLYFKSGAIAHFEVGFIEYGVSFAQNVIALVVAHRRPPQAIPHGSRSAHEIGQRKRRPTVSH